MQAPVANLTASFRRRAIVDLVALALVALAWRLDAILDGAPSSGLAWVVALGAGLGVGYVGFAVHEWGHLLGALLTASRVEPARRFPFLFRFEATQHAPRQVAAMSAGGYLATLAMVLAVAAFVPHERTSGMIALAVTALGVLATLVVEVPETVAWWRGGMGLSRVSGDQRNDLGSSPASRNQR
ncbi:MAG: hypothetical protein KC731_03800 [Myxococcales bacterium]|nr:hypothetical protein [Myxococcales bacterium]